MNTFLPYPSYSQSVQCLDRLRLGKQRLECLTILKTNLGLSSAWQNHPCTKQWRGFEVSLSLYTFEIIKEWKRRNYKDSCEEKLFKLIERKDFIDKPVQEPPWLGNYYFHSSHRAALLYKNFEHYSKFGWTEEPKLCYVWGV